MIGPFNTIGDDEKAAVSAVMTHHPLSGYLAGKERGGRMVCALEDRWAEEFKVKHAIACNSATSGLLAAAFAIGLKPGDQFFCPAMTMSATAAAPMFTGATPIFGDVDDRFFALKATDCDVKAVFLTHLFGAAIDEAWWRGWAHQEGAKLIVDAAQAPFAMEPKSDRFAGTIGDIGVFSLNVHKPIQCGEGGIIVTNDDDLADRMRHFINHGENVAENIGLNLRMPEVCAAIGLTQLSRAEDIIGRRRAQAEELVAEIGAIPGIRPPVVREGMEHVYYTIPFLIDVHLSKFGDPRATFCSELRELGVPIVEGYIDPLYRLPAFKEFPHHCPVAEDLQDHRLFYFENCAWDLTPAQIKGVGDAFKRAAEKVL
jgi:perosamine synthetase